MQRSYYTLSLIWLLLWGMSTEGFVASTRDLMILSEYGHSENIYRTLEQDSRESTRPAGLGAASNLLLTALYQDIPILVPTGLWSAIVEHKKLFDAFTQSTLDQLVARYGSYTRFRDTSQLSMLRQLLIYCKQNYQQVSEALETASQTEQSLETLEKKIHTILKRRVPAPIKQIDSLSWIEASRFALCAFVPLGRYIIKEITPVSGSGPGFYLFLPKTLSHALGLNEKELTRKKEVGQGLTAQEKALGLKINKFADVKDPFVVRDPRECTASSFAGLIQALRSLFIKRGEVKDTELQKWTLFIMGHGLFCEEAKQDLKQVSSIVNNLEKEAVNFRIEVSKWNKRTKMYRSAAHTLSSHHELTQKKLVDKIKVRAQTAKVNLKSYHRKYKQASQTLSHHRRQTTILANANKVVGLPLSEFQQLLLFFEEALNMGLLFYSSCSAGGKQFVDTFDNNGKQLRLSYPVLADTLSEAPAVTFHADLRLEPPSLQTKTIALNKLIDWQDKRIILDAVYDFKSFFKLSHSIKPTVEDLYLCLASLTPCFSASKNDNFCLQANDINNLISIRLPQHTSFSAIDNADCFFTVDQAVQQTARGSSQTLSVPPSAQLIALISPTLEAPLSIAQSAKKCPFFVSLIPGKAMHTLQTVDAAPHDLISLLSHFFPCEELNVPKLIRIQELICNDNHSQESMILENVELFNYVQVPGVRNIPQNGAIFTLKGEQYMITWPFNQPFDSSLIQDLLPTVHAQTTCHYLKAFFENANDLSKAIEQKNAVLSLEQVCHLLAHEELNQIS